jgi:hypothetical protein
VHHPHVRINGHARFAYGVRFAEPPPPRPAPCACDYHRPPPPPPPAYYYNTPEPAVVVARPAERSYNLGLGLRASHVKMRNDITAEGVGVLARIGIRRMELELDLGRDRFESGREDTRFGAALYVPILGGRTLSPYLLVGAGIIAARPMGQGMEEPITQGFLEGGAGLALRLGNSFAISADARWASRRIMGEQSQDVLLRETQVYIPDAPAAKESSLEGRLTGIFYF